MHQIELEMQNEELKRAKAEVEETRNRYIDLYELAPVGYLTLDENGRILEANLTAAVQLGIERSGLIKRPFQNYIVPADRDKFHSHLNEVVRSKKQQSCEIELITKSGSDFYAHLDTVFILDSSGNQLCRTTATGITELKRAEDSLREAQSEAERHARELEALMDAVPALIWITRDTECLSMTGNGAVYEFLGMPIGANVSKTAPEAARPVHFKALRDGMEIPLDELPMQQAAKGEGIQNYELEYLFDNGTSKITLGNTTPLYDATGHVYGAIAAFVDITERKRMEDELRESKTKLEAALASMTDAVFISDAKGLFVNVNEAFAKFLKFKHKDEYFKTFAEYPDVFELLIAGKQVPPEMWPVKRALSGETATNVEYTLRRKDTGETWIGSHSFSPIRDENGVILGSVVTARDITERKQMEKELRKSHDYLELHVQERTAELKTYMAKLEESNQALQDFASIASHDLQEPLRKVAAFGNMLKQKCGGSLEDHGGDYLERILNANQRMQFLLTGLLDYSRATTKTEPFKEVDLSDLIGEVISDLEVRIVRTGGEVHVGTLPVISADPTQMRQLLQNLIGNALKFHKPDEKPRVQVRSVSNTDSKCQIIVEDNGIGFEEQNLEKIFAPFQRLHGRSSQYEGTGMGLAICKKIVERHGGSITARSTPGQGATFTVTLPAKQQTKT